MTLLSTLVSYKDGRLHQSALNGECDARRYRARELINSVAHLTHQGRETARFKVGRFTVNFFADGVNCSCPDFANRYQHSIICKHIFAAMHHLGDQFIAKTPAPKLPETATKTKTISPRKKIRPQDVRVGRWFMLSDFLFSDTALKMGLPNILDINSEYGQDVLAGMELLCKKLLDPICDDYGRITITRGYLGEAVYRHLYPKNGDNWVKGALAHGFQEFCGCDFLVHQPEFSPLEFSLKLRTDDRFTFDFLRMYPNSQVICCGVGRFQNRRQVMEWRSSYRGMIKY
jgi:hypothetical protein